MKIAAAITIIFVLCIGMAPSVAARGDLKKITESVYAYTDVKNASPSNSFGANAGIIIGQSFVAVVDTLDTAKEAREMITQIRKITAKPIRYVINTHFHYDHVLGNFEFERAKAQGDWMIKGSLQRKYFTSTP